MIAAPRRARLSFGQFEVDLDGGEIRRAGLRVKLAAQPFRVLTALLARPGEVVSHEQLQQEIWGANTNIDFERGIAGAINKVREALGDSADNPRFIETLAKRGYRFIAPVVAEPTSPATEMLAPAVVPIPAPGSTKLLEQSPEKADLPLVLPAPAAAEPLPPAAPLPAAGKEQRIPSQRWPDRRVPLSFVALVAPAVAALACWITYGVVHRTAPSQPSRIEQLTSSSAVYAGPPNPENFFFFVRD